MTARQGVVSAATRPVFVLRFDAGRVRHHSEGSLAMGTHEQRVHADDLHNVQRGIERSGDRRLVSIIPAGDTHYIVKTEDAEPRMERRVGSVK